jgi:hypothetical protein
LLHLLSLYHGFGLVGYTHVRTRHGEGRASAFENTLTSRNFYTFTDICAIYLKLLMLSCGGAYGRKLTQ